MGNEQKRMDIFILLDRTGSMAPQWVEAVSSVNTYVRELAKEGAGDRITLAAFDAYESGMQFDILRDAMPITEWKEVGDDEVLPRGRTGRSTSWERTSTAPPRRASWVSTDTVR